MCFSSGGNILQIPRVQLEDAGKYTCQAVNEAGEDKMHYDLEVLGKEADQTSRYLQIIQIYLSFLLIMRMNDLHQPD